MTEGQNEASSSSPATSASSTLVSGSPSSSNWHTIRPWFPLLTLSVKEVTSVSVTFLLSATITPPPDLDIDIDAELEGDDNQSIISEALAKGLSVKVNGSPWQRVIIRIDDSADEAIIIIYGLMPGRQYDIDLGIVHTRHLRHQVTTEDHDAEPPSPSSPSVSTIIPGPPAHIAANGTTPSSQPATNESSTSSTTDPPAPPPFTIEDRLSQLNSTLSLLSSDRESIQSQIKTVRRDGQKADAALRSEIEALKRSSEKSTAAEARAKQKILALQEAVKRAQAGARATEEQLSELESLLPALTKEREKKELEYQTVKTEAENVRKEREDADEKDKKRLERLRAEISTMMHKLEKMTGKREKMEGTVIPDLEEQLKQTRQDLESVEREEEELAIEELASYSGIGIVGQQDSYSLQGFSTSSPRRRANTGGSSLSNPPGPISRPSRASYDNTTSSTSVSPTAWNLTAPGSGARLRDPLPLGAPLDPSQRIPQPRPQEPLRSSTGSSTYPYPPGLLPLPPTLNNPFADSLSLHSHTTHSHTKSYSHPITNNTTTSSPSSSSSGHSPIHPSHPPLGYKPSNMSPLSGRAIAFGTAGTTTGGLPSPVLLPGPGPQQGAGSALGCVGPIQRPATGRSGSGSGSSSGHGSVGRTKKGVRHGHT